MGGFVGTGLPEALLLALRRRFDATARPAALSLLMVASVGDSKGRGAHFKAYFGPSSAPSICSGLLSRGAGSYLCRVERCLMPAACCRPLLAGMDVLAREGLLGRVVFGWAGNCPGFGRLVREGKVQAWNVPLGVASHMIRDVAAGRAGPVTRIGLGTFVDPREQVRRTRTRPRPKQSVAELQLGSAVFVRAVAAVDAESPRRAAAGKEACRASPCTHFYCIFSN